MEKILIWGTGLIANRFYKQFDFKDFSILGFIDNDIKKQGQKFNNHMVYSPDILEKASFDKLIIMSNQKAFNEITNQIKVTYAVDEDKIKDVYYIVKNSLINRYKDNDDAEVGIILEYLKNHDLQVFNYEFADKYQEMPVDVKFDNTSGLYFVSYKGKKMYFSKKLDTKEKVINYYRSICLEQDPMSPHLYFGNNHTVCDGQVVVDLGVAEGNFSLDVIDNVSKLYIIEGDNDWIEALQFTFKEYLSKVVILNKFISDIKTEEYDTLDNLIKEPVDFIKMDIEGYETAALKGAKKLFAMSEKLKCSICAYHNENDEKDICSLLREYGMKYTATKGLMWYPWSIQGSTYGTDLRRGVILSER